MANKPLKTIKFPGLPDVYTIGSGLSDAVKEALLACFQRVAWTTDEGQQLYQALYDSFYLDVRLASLSAAFTQGSRVIYTTDSLNTLRRNLVVTATYYSGTTAQISDYVLSGTLTAGTSIITATYGGKTATFEVIVTAKDIVIADSTTFGNGWGYVSKNDGNFYVVANKTQLCADVRELGFSAGDIISIPDYETYRYHLCSVEQADSSLIWIVQNGDADHTLTSQEANEAAVIVIYRADGADLSNTDKTTIYANTKCIKA